jgi:hypothetical protein
LGIERTDRGRLLLDTLDTLNTLSTLGSLTTPRVSYRKSQSMHSTALWSVRINSAYSPGLTTYVYVDRYLSSPKLESGLLYNGLCRAAPDFVYSSSSQIAADAGEYSSDGMSD